MTKLYYNITIRSVINWDYPCTKKKEKITNCTNNWEDNGSKYDYEIYFYNLKFEKVCTVLIQWSSVLILIIWNYK